MNFAGVIFVKDGVIKKTETSSISFTKETYETYYELQVT
jgi:hypothetical protein